MEMNSLDQKGGSVAVLADYRKPMKHPVMAELLDHWEALRAGRMAPRRSEIDPRKIEIALSHAFILEQTHPTAARFRIAGMRLCDTIGMELRGMPAHALIDLPDRDRFNDLIAGLFKTPEIVELSLSEPGCHPARPCEMLLLPMTNDAGEIARILGALVYETQQVQAPTRFKIEKLRRTRIITQTAERQEMPMGFAEAAPDFEPATPQDAAKSGSRPYLRLVASRDPKD